jgi:hypothetical protein
MGRKRKLYDKIVGGLGDADGSGLYSPKCVE